MRLVYNQTEKTINGKGFNRTSQTNRDFLNFEQTVETSGDVLNFDNVGLDPVSITIKSKIKKWPTQKFALLLNLSDFGKNAQLSLLFDKDSSDELSHFPGSVVLAAGELANVHNQMVFLRIKKIPGLLQEEPAEKIINEVFRIVNGDSSILHSEHHYFEQLKKMLNLLDNFAGTDNFYKEFEKTFAFAGSDNQSILALKSMESNDIKKKEQQNPQADIIRYAKIKEAREITKNMKSISKNNCCDNETKAD